MLCGKDAKMMHRKLQWKEKRRNFLPVLFVFSNRGREVVFHPGGGPLHASHQTGPAFQGQGLTVHENKEDTR